MKYLFRVNILIIYKIYVLFTLKMWNLLLTNFGLLKTVIMFATEFTNGNYLCYFHLLTNSNLHELLPGSIQPNKNSKPQQND